MATINARVVRTDKSGTIASGGVAQTLAAARTDRQGFWLQNQSNADLWVNEIGSTAAATQPAIRIPAGAYWIMEDTGVTVAAISIFGATTGQAFAAREW